MDYSKECIRVFLENQAQLFGKVIAETVSEAREVLEDNMAAEVDTIKDVRDYLEENGMDISEMTDEEVISQSEVFKLPSGRFLIVTG